MKKIDFHVHTSSNTTVEESVMHFKSMMKENGYDFILIEDVVA